MGPLVCRIELNKKTGLTLSVVNESGKITQTAALDGTTITLTCKGDEETSTIVQQPDSISLECKTFSLNAETITLKSSKQSRYQSEETIDIQSTKDMHLDSKAGLTGRAADDVNLKGRNVTVAADSKAAMSGASAEVKASGKAQLSAAALSLSGSTKMEMEGLQVKISAKGMMDLEANGIATLKGQMANLKGTLVKIG